MCYFKANVEYCQAISKLPKMLTVNNTKTTSECDFMKLNLPHQNAKILF